MSEKEVSTSKKRNAWRRRQRCCLMQPTNSFESFPVYSFTAVRIYCSHDHIRHHIHDHIHHHIHDHIHHRIHDHITFTFVTNFLPIRYKFVTNSLKKNIMTTSLYTYL